MVIGRSRLDKQYPFQPHSIHAMNEFQQTCNNMKIKAPLPSNVTSAESIIYKHIIQTYG